MHAFQSGIIIGKIVEFCNISQEQMKRGKSAPCRILALRTQTSSEVAFCPSLSFEPLRDANHGIFFFLISNCFNSETCLLLLRSFVSGTRPNHYSWTAFHDSAFKKWQNRNIITMSSIFSMKNLMFQSH